MRSSIKPSTEKKIGACLKKTLLPVFVLGIFIAGHAQFQQYNPGLAVHKEIVNSQAFENVEVRGDVTIILTNSPASNIELQGNVEDINLVTAIEKDNKLEITAKRTGSDLIVFLPASRMHSLKIAGDSRIFSSGDIAVDDLVITLKGDSIVKVYHHGKLTVIPAKGFEMTDVVGTY